MPTYAYCIYVRLENIPILTGIIDDFIEIIGDYGPIIVDPRKNKKQKQTTDEID